jgi:excisionase family DNA binding protein
MSSTIRVKKKCQFCQKSFIARTTVTKYCSEVCSKKGYKKKKREEKVLKVEIEEAERNFNPILGAKLFLSKDETAELLGVSSKTIYRMIKRGELNAKKLGRRVVISRKDIDNMFSED